MTVPTYPVSTPSRATSLLLLSLAVAVAGLAFLARDRVYLYELVPVACGAGGLLLALWRRTDLSVRHVVLFAILFRLMLVWLPPSLSDDAYRYVWDGTVQVDGINPYRYTPDDPALRERQEGPVYAALNSKAYYTVYPPVSQVVFAFGALFHGLGWRATYYVIKAVFVLCEIGAVLLLARMVDARSLMLYAWHPLVLLETAGQAHTESALVLCLVLALYLARRRKGGWASVALALAGWIKLYPFALLPLLWRRFGWKAVWPGGLVIAVAAAPYAAPYVWPHVRSSLDLYARLFEFNAGLYYAVKQGFYLVTGADWSKQIGPAFRALFLVGLPLIYALDARGRWMLERAFLVTLGFFIVMSTTVHPWYLLSLLALSVLLARPAWHWHWLGLLSLGTYLLYANGPYWTFVWLGWSGWLILAAARHLPGLLQGIQQSRARQKVRFIHSFLPRLNKPLELLDLGAGEGYVGAVIAQRYEADVTLADVVPMNRTELRCLLYDGRALPFEDRAFDVTLLYFVLHHAEDPGQVLREAMRVSRGRVLVVESVYTGARDHRRLVRLDRLANRLRSGGLMKAQEQHLHFRKREAWRAFFREHGAEVLAERRRGRWVHRQALFVLAPQRRGGSAEPKMRSEW